MFTVYVPTKSAEKSEFFYGEVLGFEEDVYGFIVPGDEYKFVRIQPQECSGFDTGSRRLFRFQVPRNFLSFCQRLIERGVFFEMVGQTPGGYTAVARDTDGNEFELNCESFDEDNLDVDPTEWSFFKRF